MRFEYELLGRYFIGNGYEIVVKHSEMVKELALQIAEQMRIEPGEMKFISEAAMLHDIGVCRVNAPGIFIYGEEPYIRHGVIGREILESQGYPMHALVCERHTGVGLTVDDISSQNLPLPLRDMAPQSMAEEIICFADLFYSKKPGKLEIMASPENVRRKLERFGNKKVQIFDKWFDKFGAVILQATSPD